LAGLILAASSPSPRAGRHRSPRCDEP
jgi:hypothetical protein